MNTRRARPAYVIKAEELPVLCHMAADYPRPRRLEWINRGTDQSLRPTTVEMLLRTLFREGMETPSVRRLHCSSGLRVVFQSDEERCAFARSFKRAKEKKFS